MICQVCQFENFEGNSVCENCGNPLQTGEYEPEQVLLQDDSGTAMKIVVEYAGRRQGVLEMPDKEIMVGRTDPDEGVFPELDCSFDTSLRVSRRHATLKPEGDGVYFTDQGSTNGSFINGKRVPPDTPIVLHPGDTVVLGGSVFLKIAAQ